jgi:hypothetical protein
MDRPQAYISAVETGQHRVSVVEFCEFAEALHFDIRWLFAGFSRRRRVSVLNFLMIGALALYLTVAGRTSP